MTGAVLTYAHSIAGNDSLPTVQAVGVQPLILFNLNQGF
jgi:hypothetical protein